MPQEALRHIAQIHETGVGNCATTSLVALLGPLEPPQELLQAAEEGTYQIEHLAYIAAVKYYERGIFSHIITLTPGDLTAFPSAIIKESHQKALQQDHPFRFIGGLFKELIIDEETLHGDAHVVAITGIHKTPRGTKVTVVDTSPVGENDKTPWVRKVPLKKLDERFFAIQEDEVFLVLMYGEPLNSPRLASPFAQYQIEQTYQNWQQEIIDFKEFATMGQYAEYFDTTTFFRT